MKELLLNYLAKLDNEDSLLVNDKLNVVYFRENLFYLFLCDECEFESKTRSRILKFLRSTDTDLILDELVKEPVWGPREISYSKLSIPAAGLSLLALEKIRSIDNVVYKSVKKGLEHRLSSLYVGNGVLHDSNKSKLTRNITLNTTAIAAWIRNERSVLIEKSQLHNGAFPYLWQNSLGKLMYLLPKRLAVLDLKLRGAYSPFYIDFVHHLMTLYFYMLCQPKFEVAFRGMKFLVDNIHESKLLYDFEPRLNRYKHTNLGDSSAYFYALLCLREFRQRFKQVQFEFVEKSLYEYVYSNVDKLIEEPYIGLPNDKKSFAFPRAAESCWDKLFFLTLYNE